MRRTAWCGRARVFVGAVIGRRLGSTALGRARRGAIAMLCDMCELSTINHRRFLLGCGLHFERGAADIQHQIPGPLDSVSKSSPPYDFLLFQYLTP